LLAETTGVPLEQALSRYERKENLVMAERTRAGLAELRPLYAARAE
jgi:hypothetical protein